MRLPHLAPALVTLLLAPTARADDPPSVEHQPVLCSVPEKPISLCAAISDEGTVTAARVYFRPEGEIYYSFVNMTFTGLRYCGILPAPREGRAKTIEYYVQAIDDAFQPTRTSTFRLAVQPEGVCEFPPTIEKDDARARAIKVFGTNRRQGGKLDDAFVATGVTFVPVR